MVLRLFGGRGSDRVRACPACEREIAAEATFCPSCYLVIRPEGAADLRRHLQGARIPADVYLLRKLQFEDPDVGPVIRIPGSAGVPAPAAEPLVSPPAAPADSLRPQTPDLSSPDIPLPSGAPAPAEASATKTAPVPKGRPRSRPGPRPKTGVDALLAFEAPLPPAAQSVEETPALLAWMLERDPVIPNNTELLEAIHASVFPDGPAAHLGYQKHVLLQITDDLVLHPTQDNLGSHLTLLAAAYRRAAEAYRGAADRGQEDANVALWQMSGIASRLRVEAWVYHTRHGAWPEIARPRRPRQRTPKASVS